MTGFQLFVSQYMLFTMINGRSLFIRTETFASLALGRKPTVRRKGKEQVQKCNLYDGGLNGYMV